MEGYIFSYSSPQKTEKHSYDTEFTECLESNGVQSRGGCLQSENQPQQAVSKSGLILTLASWREDLEKACRQRPGTHQHASKVNFAFFSVTTSVLEIAEYSSLQNFWKYQKQYLRVYTVQFDATCLKSLY